MIARIIITMAVIAAWIMLFCNIGSALLFFCIIPYKAHIITKAKNRFLLTKIKKSVNNTVKPINIITQFDEEIPAPSQFRDTSQTDILAIVATQIHAKYMLNGICVINLTVQFV